MTPEQINHLAAKLAGLEQLKRDANKLDSANSFTVYYDGHCAETICGVLFEVAKKAILDHMDRSIGITVIELSNLGVELTPQIDVSKDAASN